MINLKEFIKSLRDININNKLVNANKIDFYLANELINFTENIIISEISNPLNNQEDIQISINNTMLLMIVQAVKSYKSCLLLCIDGYYTTAIIILRNILDIIFNIKFIIEETPEKSLQRAEDYLNNPSRWTSETIKNRAYLSQSSTLYNIYRDISDFSHANYISTAKNITKEGYLSPYSSCENIKEAITLINTVFYYLVEMVCNIYSINKKSLDSIEKTTEFDNKYKTYKMFNFSKKYYN
ncbi:MAG: hypothetical protein K0R54_608 [Clostridiaceae bacterium]|jgi:hypothetical protein|nr:hypothetical protein [Clostridiaceae bacterium]